MINRIKDLFILALLIALSSGVTGYIVYSIEELKHEGNVTSPKGTDSLIVHHITEPTVNNITNPEKVIIQTVRDTVYREKLEKETIVSGATIEGNKLEVFKTDTAGNKSEDIHNIDPFSKVEMNNKGEVEIIEDKKAKRRAKRKKIFKSILNTGKDILIGFISFKLGKAL